MRIIFPAVLLGWALLTSQGVRAASNIRVDHAFSWSPPIGWVNWRADGNSGIKVGAYICSGFIYSANVGWINCGNGHPLSGVYYSNTGDDFGLNVDADGSIRGFAYGANIGWIKFEATGNPRVNLSTGQLSGQAYSANIGWLSLGDASYYAQIDAIDPGDDSDHDGIPDAWEIQHAGNLSRFTATSDSDGDSQSDLDEYLAGTDPLDPADVLRITDLVPAKDGGSVTVSWPAKPARQYFIETRPTLDAGVPWADSGLGPIVSENSTASKTIPTRGHPTQFFRIRAALSN